MSTLFWIFTGIIFYTYIGYAGVLYILVRIKRLKNRKLTPNVYDSADPDVTLFVTAYNERDYIQKKMENSRALNYPAEKLHFVWVTDGSDDGTPELLQKYNDVTVYHLPQRNGKINAMNRGMQFIKTPIVIFSDANAMLGNNSVQRIVNLFKNPQVGCVSGEKRIHSTATDTASGTGEGLYWKYESALKKWDAELYSAVGAAGELFAIRSELYQEVEKDTLLDDFIISLRVAQNGFLIQYDPEAYAMELPSASVKEELKRKIRISAGGIQSVIRLRSLLNIFKYKTLSFQYISHRVLRWTITPLCLLLLLPVSAFLGFQNGIFENGIFATAFWLQVIFYIAAIIGWILENRSIKVKALFVPYYFFIMNLSVFLGCFRFFTKTQSVNWDKAKRAA